VLDGLDAEHVEQRRLGWERRRRGDPTRAQGRQRGGGLLGHRQQRPVEQRNRVDVPFCIDQATVRARIGDVEDRLAAARQACAVGRQEQGRGAQASAFVAGKVGEHGHALGQTGIGYHEDVHRHAGLRRRAGAGVPRHGLAPPDKDLLQPLRERRGFLGCGGDVAVETIV
jgi:hypothetical protein